MEKQYAGLTSLLQKDRQARAYYEALPCYLRELVARGGREIRCARQLRERAGHLLDSLHG